jgi:hypothetical protein
MSNKSKKQKAEKTALDPVFQYLVDSIPMPLQDFRDLFRLLTRADRPECDHTLKQTIAFLKERGLDTSEIVPWLRQNGGFCDCEVFLNVIFGRFSELLE